MNVTLTMALVSVIAAVTSGSTDAPKPASVSPAPSSTILGIKWLRKPDASDFARLYPQKARAAKLGGHVTMRCKVVRDGLLDQCEILSEEPQGYGFGEATLRLQSRFRMSPRSSDGSPSEGGVVMIPISWRW